MDTFLQPLEAAGHLVRVIGQSILVLDPSDMRAPGSTVPWQPTSRARHYYDDESECSYIHNIGHPNPLTREAFVLTLCVERPLVFLETKLT